MSAQPVFKLQISQASRDSTVDSHVRAVERVIHAMRGDLEHALSLRAMAKIAYFSPYYFNRTFRQVTGIPPCQYLYALRLEAASTLLLHTEQTVLDICYEVGYNSLGTFTRRFTELMGLSPKRFRVLARSREPLSVFDSAWREEAGQAAGQNTELLSAENDLVGRVYGPESFEGLILVGLFETPIPQGKPVACALLKQTGTYRIAGVPEGKYYLFAAGLKPSEDSRAQFHNNCALRGGGQAITFTSKGITGSSDLELRAPSAVDPPMLLALPLLIAGRYGSQRETKVPPAALMARATKAC